MPESISNQTFFILHSFFAKKLMINYDQGIGCLNTSEFLFLQGFRSRTKYSFCPLHQPKAGYFFCINIFRGYQIDPRGLDTAVAQHIGKS